MGDLIKLSQLNVCESAVIKNINICGSMKRRLQDLGLISGTVIKCVLKNNTGSTSAFCVRGAVIALRKTDTDFIEVKPLKRRFGNYGIN